MSGTEHADIVARIQAGLAKMKKESARRPKYLHSHITRRKAVSQFVPAQRRPPRRRRESSATMCSTEEDSEGEEVEEEVPYTYHPMCMQSSPGKLVWPDKEESDQGKGLHIPCPSSSANAKKKTGLWAAAISSNNQYGSSSLQIQAAQLASRREWEEKQRREAELKRTVIAENHRAVAAGGWGVPGPQTGQTVNSLGA